MATTAAAETAVGEGPWASRSAAWLGTIATMGLLWLLLRDLRVRSVRASAAVIAGMGCHMVVTYGLMLDTPVTSLPFGVAALVVWARTWQGDAVHPALAASAAAGAALAGWQAALLVGLGVVALAVRGPRGRGSVARAWPLAIGLVAGTVVSLGWGLWTYGDLSEMVRKYALRSGETEGVGLGDMVSFQLPWLGQLLGLGLLGIVACAVSAREPRWRPVAALSLATVVGYAVLFRGAAAGHQYWLYWAVLPATLGYGYLFGPVAERVRHNLDVDARAMTAGIVGIAVLVAGIGLSRTDQAGDLIDRGNAAAELVRDTPLPAGQASLLYVSQPARADDWVLYLTGRRPTALLDVDQLRAVAAEHPDHLVLVLGGCDEVTAALCESIGRPVSADPGPAEIVRVHELAALLRPDSPG